MCGITGIVNTTCDQPVPEGWIRRMNGSLAHRGPDGDGFHFEAGVGLGHRRLSIIDLESGRQPLYNEDGTVVVTYNGEIYNFQALTRELEQRGHTFRTRCDTEVIVHAWEEWGERCVDHFNGMFAFGIWDRKRRCLFLARDRLGIKPLYYTELGSGRVAFASELKALMALPELDRALDPTAIEDYFTFGYVPDPKTIFGAVRKLEPGHHLTVRAGCGALRPARYWDVPLEAEPVLQDAACLSEVAFGLKQAVERRLVADVPLGAFLSGGIDSSAVVAMMREIGVDHLLTCSIGFDEAQFDESRYALKVAEAKATDHRWEQVETADYDLLDTLGNVYDEPFADSSAIPTYRVCQLARKHVTVALSGDGGDENFLGYRRYGLFRMEERLRSPIPQSIRQSVFGPLGRYYPKLDWAPRVFRGKTTFESLARSASEGYRHGVSIASDQLREALFSEGFRRELQGYHAREVFERHLEGKRFEDPLRMVQYLDFKTYLPGDILTKVDRASMAHSLEVRVPFLDYQYVEQIARLPSSVKLKGRESKYALKKALEPYLPREVLYREKMGFAVPLGIWFRKSLAERMTDVVTGQRLLDTGIFNAEKLETLLSEHRGARRDHSAVLWSLLMFDAFLCNEEATRHAC